MGAPTSNRNVAPLSEFDPKSDRFMDNPFDFYKLMREEAPIYHEPSSGIFFVGTYELAQQVMTDPVLFTSRVDRASMRAGGLPKRVLDIKAEGWPLAMTMSQNDEPSHDVYRNLVAHFFKPSKLKEIEPFIREKINELLDAIETKDECDFLTAFAIPLPISVIGKFLGLSDYSDETLKVWSDAFADEIGFLTSDERAIEIAEQCLECHRAMIRVCEARREKPDNDIISHLVSARIENNRLLNESELLSILTQLLVAGNETTTNTLVAGMRRLGEDRTLFQRLKENPDLIFAFVEETLRLESPVQGQFRMAMNDTNLGGVTIPKGSLLHVRFASANRDETVFGSNSASMSLEAKQPKPHMSFGMGMHFCVGAMLSRLELRLSFEALMERDFQLEIAVPSDRLRYHTHFHLRGMTALPLRVVPSP